MASTDPKESARLEELKNPEARQQLYEQAQLYASGKNMPAEDIANLQLSLRALDIRKDRGPLGSLLDIDRVKVNGQKDDITAYAANKFIDKYEVDQHAAQIPGNGPLPAATVAAVTTEPAATQKKPETAEAKKVDASEPAKPAAPQPDMDVRKFQAYYKALTNDAKVDVDGKPREIEADGVEGPVTRAALAKYKKDQNLPEDADLSTVNTKLEQQIKDDPAAVSRFSKETMSQGPNASSNDMSALQLILNVIATLFGGKKLNINGKADEPTMQSFSKANEHTNGALAGGLPGRAQIPPVTQPGVSPTSGSGSTDITMASPGRDAPGSVTVAPGSSTFPVATPQDGVIPTITVGAAPSASQDFRVAANQPPSGGPSQVIETAPQQASQPIVLQNPPVPSGPPMTPPQLGQQGVATPVYNSASTQVAPSGYYSAQVAQANASQINSYGHEYVQPQPNQRERVREAGTQVIENRATRDNIKTGEMGATSDSRVGAINTRNYGQASGTVRREVGGWARTLGIKLGHH